MKVIWTMRRRDWPADLATVLRDAEAEQMRADHGDDTDLEIEPYVLLAESERDKIVFALQNVNLDHDPPHVGYTEADEEEFNALAERIEGGR